MLFGFVPITMIPLRKEPSHRSEMVSQCLFGDIFAVKDVKGDWLQVCLHYDGYEGWLDQKQIRIIAEQEYLRLSDFPITSAGEVVDAVSVSGSNTMIPVVLGSSLPGITDGHFRVEDEVFHYEGQVLSTLIELHNTLQTREHIVTHAWLFLHAPYLWGGRSPFGIDCSGLTQMVYKLSGIPLLRDASQQATQGEPVGFLSEAEKGDLVFFDDPEGNITHTGILISPQHIIHASGKVKIDLIDHHGIYDETRKAYSHRLRLIRKMI
ncbi:MAG: NlpC/P60 family protein [Bacteroidetes bacterium]|nr:NlpC/P60 family protein [Bacteroidota bacterium]